MAIKIKVKTVLNKTGTESYFGETYMKENKSYKQKGKVTIRRGNNRKKKVR